MAKNPTRNDIGYVADVCQIAIRKKDPEIRHQIHPVIPGRGWDERRSLEVSYYLLTLAVQTAKRNVRRAEVYANRAMQIMEVFGVVPEADDEGKAILTSFFPPATKKPS